MGISQRNIVLEQERDTLDKAFRYWSDYAFQKSLNPTYAGEPLDIAALILPVAYVFPSLSLTITPEWHWEFSVGTDWVRQYAFPEPGAAVSHLRSIVGKMGFRIEESLKAPLYHQIPLPPPLQQCTGESPDERAEYLTQWLHYEVRIDREAEQRGIEPINPYGFNIELIYTERQTNQWLVSVETQNNMQIGLPFLKMSSRSFP